MRNLISIFLLFITLQMSGSPSGARLRAEWFHQKLNDTNLPNSERLRFADSLITVSPESAMADALIWKASIAIDDLQYQFASETLAKAGKAINPDSLRTKLQWHNMSSLAAYYMFDYRKAIDHNLTILETTKPDSLTYFDMRACLKITDVFMRLKKFDLAHKYNDKARDIYEEYNKSWAGGNYKANIYRSLSSIHLEEHDYDSALKDLKAAQQAANTRKEKEACMINLGLTYMRMGMFDMADEQFSTYLSGSHKGQNRAICAMNYVLSLIDSHNVAKAIEIKEKYSEELASLEKSVLSPHIKIIESQIARYQGDKERALDCLWDAYALNDSIMSAQGNIYLNEIMSEFEDRERDLENRRVVRGSETKSIVINALCGLVVIFGAAGWLLLRRHRRRNEDNKELESKIATLDLAHRQETREAENQLDTKQQQLSVIALQMERIKDTIDRIRQQADNRRGNMDDRLSNIRHSIKELQMEENVWGTFNVYFEQANRLFFEKLHRICPSLTNAELRLCASILSNMTTKEIAVMTNRSVRTVETTRYNIRKKLNIKTSTEEYLRNVSVATPEEMDEMRAAAARQ